MPEHLLNTKEACRYLGIEEKKLRELVRKKIIPAYKIGGAYLRFKKEHLDIAQSAINDPAKSSVHLAGKADVSDLDRIKDFLYFNDFYIISICLVVLAVIMILTP